MRVGLMAIAAWLCASAALAQAGAVVRIDVRFNDAPVTGATVIVADIDQAACDALAVDIAKTTGARAVGMAVDTSHCGDRTTMDACEVSKKPVLITHSNCRALNPQWLHW